MAEFFKDWFFRQFPERDQMQDAYKDSDGEGLLMRYLRTFGVELDENIIPYVHNFVDLVDYEKCDDKFLPLIAGILGSPPSLGTDADLYRKVIAYAVAIYKIKGTLRSYEIFFNLLGLEIEMIEAIPAKKITYDMIGVVYDEEYVYDSECDNCSEYTINIITPTNLDATLLAKITNFINFIQPINAKLKELKATIPLTDLVAGYINGSKVVEDDIVTGWDDISDNQHHLTSVGDPADDGDDGIIFDGVDDDFSKAESILVDGEYTIYAYVKIFDFGDSGRELLGSSFGGRYGFHFFAHLLYHFPSSGGYYYNSIIPNMVSGEFICCTITCNSTSTKLYINGNFFVDLIKVGAPVVSFDFNRFKDIYLFKGNIRNIAVYRKAHSAAQVQKVSSILPLV